MQKFDEPTIEEQQRLYLLLDALVNTIKDIVVVMHEGYGSRDYDGITNRTALERKLGILLSVRRKLSLNRDIDMKNVYEYSLEHDDNSMNT